MQRSIWHLLVLTFVITSTATAQLPDQVKAESVGMAAERLTRISNYFRKMVDAGQLPGAINLVARRGKIVHLDAQGSLNNGGVIKPDTIVRIASMTKPVTSVAMMLLYEEGLFQLNDPVSDYFPSFNNQQVVMDLMSDLTEDNLTAVERPMTIRDVFMHTAGLPFTSTGFPAAQFYAKNVDRPGRDLMDWAAAMGQGPLLYQPGTRWAYSNATTLLGALVEKISGVPFEDYLRDRIYIPLGMNDTGFYVPEQKLNRLAGVYKVSEDGGYEPLVTSFLSDKITEPPIRPNGAGGLYSTLQDYFYFAQMLANRGEYSGIRLLSSKSVDFMTMDHLPADVKLPDVFVRSYLLKGYGFGLGFRVRTDVAASQMQGNVGEYGWAGAFETYFLIDPTDELVAINITQLSPTGHYPLRRQFNNLVYQAIVE